jgi:competence protein ComEC
MAEPLLQIDFWDVGQGDCSVVRLPDENLIIIDVGPVGSPLVDWLNERKPQLSIELIVLTHNDYDHAGALTSIVKEHGERIKGIRMLQDRDRNSSTFLKIFRAAVDGHNRNLYSLERLETGARLWSHEETNTRLTVLHPSFVQNVQATKPNDTSAVILLSVGERALIVWPGDLEIRNTANILNGVRPDILFGPHHGGPSDYPTKAMRSKSLLQIPSRMADIREAVTSISPSRSFISVGTRNHHHHPRPGFLKLLANSGTKISCSEITNCCDRKHISESRPVFQGAGALGLRAPRNGVACRGAMRYYLRDDTLIPDEYEEEHRIRVQNLLRPQCVLRPKL